MKERFFKYIYLLVLALAVGTYSCADLEVENLNEPDAERALANPDDLATLAGGAFKTALNGINEYDGPGLAMGVMADQFTCSWGNAAMNDLSSEPRKGWQNSITYSYSPVTRVFWQSQYSGISSVNDVLFAIEEQGVKLGDNGSDNELVRAWSYFVSGVAHGYIGMVFDQGFIVSPTSDVLNLELMPWNEVAAFGVQQLETAISICETNTFDVPDGWLSGGMTGLTNEYLSKLAASYAARIMIGASRNATHDAAVDWSKVKTLAQKGLTFDDPDFAPDLGRSDEWYDYHMVYQIYPGWGRTDHRIINLMDPDYPSRWPDESDWESLGFTEAGPGKAVSDDARLLSDFQFMPDQAFNPTRGHYHFSHYRCKRYDYMMEIAWYGVGKKGCFMVQENQMNLSEALIRADNDKTGAIAILNNALNPRIVRGELDPIDAGATVDDVAFAIQYEKDIETYLTGMGVGYFDMRRKDKLQRGTILHFPVPANELEILTLPNYTISGAPDGVNIAEKGWTGLDGIKVPAEGW